MLKSAGRVYVHMYKQIFSEEKGIILVFTNSDHSFF